MRLTRFQVAALQALERDPQWKHARVVGWDTSVAGPLLRLGPEYIAVSPRGRRVKRDRKKVAP